MQAIEAIKKRRSVRIFKPQEVPEPLIKELIDCARLAPTARNEQPWEFVVVTRGDLLKELANLTDHGKFISQSPCCIAVFCRETKYYLEDGCAATENILIAAVELGLVSCWVAGDKKTYCGEVKRLLGVPKDFKLVSLIALGYSDAPLTNPSKRALSEVIHWQGW